MVGKGANGVIIAAGALATDELNECIRDLQARQAHVHLSSGVQGVDYRRLLPAPLAHEPLLYLEPTDLSHWQLAIKRAQDIAVSGLLLAGRLAGADPHGAGRVARRPRPGPVQADPGGQGRRACSRSTSSVPWWSTPRPG